MEDSSADDDSLNCSGELSEIVVQGRQLGKLRIRFPPCPPSRDKSSKVKPPNATSAITGTQVTRPASGDSAADSGIFDNYTSSATLSGSESDEELAGFIKKFRKKCKSGRREMQELRAQNAYLRNHAKEQWKARVKSEELMVEMRSHLNQSRKQSTTPANANHKATNTHSNPQPPIQPKVQISCTCNRICLIHVQDSERSNAELLQQINRLEADIGVLLAEKRRGGRSVRVDNARHGALLGSRKVSPSSSDNERSARQATPLQTTLPIQNPTKPSQHMQMTNLQATSNEVATGKDTLQRLPPV